MSNDARIPSFTMKRRGFLALTLSTGALAACGAPGGSTAGDSAGSTGGGDPDTIRAATYLPPTYEDIYPGIQLFMDAASEASGGATTFDMFDSGTLLAADQLVPGLTRGVADVVFQTSSYVSTTYPVLGCIELPFGNDGPEQVVRALDLDGELHALINEQLGAKGLHMISSMPTNSQFIWTKDKPIRKPEDMRGLRLRTAGVVEGETVKAFGGAPVSMSSAEVYEALERGTIDGMISYPGTIISRDLQEVIRYGTMGHFGLYSVDVYCRKDWWDGLSDDLRAALVEGGKRCLAEATPMMLKVHEEKYFPAMEEAGLELIELSDQETAVFTEAAGEVEQWWYGQVGDEAIAKKALDLVRNA